MKKLLSLSLVFSILLVLNSCKKELYYQVAEECSECTDNRFEELDNVLDGVEQFIVSPIEFDASCNCIVSGRVVYKKDGKKLASVDYGDGSCDGWATKSFYSNCKSGCSGGSAVVSCCEFKQNCSTVK